MFGSRAKSHRERVYAVLTDRLPAISPSSTINAEEDEILIRTDGSRARISTRTLLSSCERQPQRRWPDVVDTWLTAVTQQVTDIAASPAPVDPARLRVQAVPRSGPSPLGVSSQFNSAFDLLVVEDHADLTRRLTKADVDALQMTAEQAVSTGLGSTVREVLVQLDVRPHTLPGGGEIRMGAGDGVPYVSAGITTVRQLAGVDSPYGTLVAVPRHSMIVVQPVTSRAELDSLPVLAGVVASLYDQGTDRCARDVYWFVNDDAHLVTVAHQTGGRPQISLPADIAAIAATLPG